MKTNWLLPAAEEQAVRAGPAYFRETFPYTLPPLTRFEPEAVPLDPAPRIWITDTTFRDGQQSRAPYTPEQIAHLYRLLSRLGGPRGMIRQSEFFLYSEKDRRAVLGPPHLHGSRADVNASLCRAGAAHEPGRGDSRPVARHLGVRAVRVDDADRHVVSGDTKHLDRAVGSGQVGTGRRPLKNEVDVPVCVPARRSQRRSPPAGGRPRR